VILADTGFLYALVDRDDAWHARCLHAASGLTEGLITTWPVCADMRIYPWTWQTHRWSFSPSLWGMAAF
jgi:predicted nucleic acid-binding protein